MGNFGGLPWDSGGRGAFEGPGGGRTEARFHEAFALESSGIANFILVKHVQKPEVRDPRTPLTLTRDTYELLV